ncbi:MAG: hypothetical protein BGWL_c0720 [Candidatus Phytoplasma cynodontis]|uniref:Wadjet anti-phage system protein JetA family protein n=1 Tax='Cynodon dactylon' phytoplasma TaxID=295320 RepID=UPI001265C03F|nr:Wadjet anti-phage system protein JetA family protein ['Cynodon dactylon' phytoplasma]KAB8122021.1 hypothetical protein F1741_00560 ['Cynodon dactylon' phytoplasma]WIA07562.1 MAG: hypothetical protein BGWL_c0720 [Candidatus Phytoplasma cynodontis]
MALSELFKIIPNNFFQLLTSTNKNIYVDCLLILEKLLNQTEYSHIDKNVAIKALENYFNNKSDLILEDENYNKEVIINNRQKAFKIIYMLKKNGWLGEERINHSTINLNFFDYSLEMINFFKKTLNDIKKESIGDIYSIYSLLKFFLIEKNYATFHEVILKTQNLIIKLQILKANIYRFYHQLLNISFKNNIKEILEQLLLDYKKNFFDYSYYSLKTNDNFFKYKRKINFFLEKIQKNKEYNNFLYTELLKINNISFSKASETINFEIENIKQNFMKIDKLIEIIDKKNEQYLQKACEKILFFNNLRDNSKNILNFIIKIIFENKIEYQKFFHFQYIRNLDKMSLYKPRFCKREINISPLIQINSKIEKNIKKKKDIFLNKDYFYNKQNINIFVEKILKTKNPLKASDINLENNKNITRLILIYLYSHSTKEKNNYKIKRLNKKVYCKKVKFYDFLIFKK